MFGESVDAGGGHRTGSVASRMGKSASVSGVAKGQWKGHRVEMLSEFRSKR